MSRNASQAKVYGKDYMEWAAGEDGEGCEWEMEEPDAPEVRETRRTGHGILPTGHRIF